MARRTEFTDSYGGKYEGGDDFMQAPLLSEKQIRELERAEKNRRTTVYMMSRRSWMK